MSANGLSNMSAVIIDNDVDESRDALLRQQFREVMAGVATPVSIVTTFSGDRPHGATVSAFMSLSMEPPLVLISLDKRSELLRLIHATQCFGLNVLGHGQHEVAATFAKRAADKFHDLQWHARHGVPRLADICGWVACDVSEFLDAGDHTMIIGRVIEAEHELNAPLTYHRRTFGTHVGR